MTTKQLRNQLRTFVIENMNKFNIRSVNAVLNKIDRGQRKTLEALKEQFAQPASQQKLTIKAINENNKILNTKKYENIVRVEKGFTDYYRHQREFNDAKQNNNVVVQLVKFYDNNGKLINTINITTNNIKEFRTLANFKLRDGTQGDYYVDKWFEEEPNGYVEIITRRYDVVNNIDTAKKYIQNFRENDNGTCVYDCFVNYFKDKKSIKAVQKYNNLQRPKIKARFAKAYTFDEIDEIAKFCDSSFEIVDLVNSENRIINSNSNNRFNVRVFNTKYNHVDLIKNIENVEIINRYEYEDLKIYSNFYIEAYGKIITTDKCYEKVKTDFDNDYDEWKQKVKYNELTMTYGDDVYNFINNYDYSTHRFTKTNEEHLTLYDDNKIYEKLYDEFDAKKAYYNYSDKSKNKYYKGLPSGAFISVKTHETFKYENLQNMVGFFEIEILDNVLAKYGFTKNSIHVLFTPTIDLLINKNVKFNFLNACYAPSVHIPFTEKLLNKYDKYGYITQPNGVSSQDMFNISGYCKVYGMMNKNNDDIDITIKPLQCDRDYFTTINNDNNIIYANENIVKIKKKNKNATTHKHLFNAIHAYNKTIILDKIIDIGDNVVGVKVDSIVVKKNTYINTDVNFDKKKTKLSFLVKCRSDEYFNDLFVGCKRNKDFKNSFLYTNEYIYSKNIFLGGAGGTGKTTSLINALDNKKICFSSTSWDLINTITKPLKKVKPNGECGVSPLLGLSLPKITGTLDNKQQVEIYNIPHVKYLIIDEATMINERTINKILELYPYKMIFVLGDIDKDGFAYQSSMGDCIKNLNKFQYIQYTKNYRFTDELCSKLQLLRTDMKNNLSIDELHNKVKLYFKNNLIKKEDFIYDNNTEGICCSNETGDKSNKLTEYFVNKGAKPRYFVKTTNLKKNLMRGAELLENPTDKNYDEVLFKTIHAYQGRTIPVHKKLVISFENAFESNLFYTALSRAKSLEQINILNF